MTLRMATFFQALICSIGISLSFGASATAISVVDGDHDVINGVYSYDLGLIGLGHTSTLYADSAVGWAAALAGTDTIVVEQGGFTAASTTSITSWIGAGGRMIVLGDTYYNTESVLSAILGTPTTTGSNSGSASKTTAATGTTFADDDPTIYYASSTHPMGIGNSAIDQVFYTGTGGDWVVRAEIGSGDLFYLAWDYCCGSEPVSDGWYGVLDSAINYESTAVPAPPMLGLLGLGLIGIALSRKQRKQGRLITQ